MAEIPPFGWLEDEAPDIDATNLEKDRNEIGKYAETQAATAGALAEANSDPRGSANTAETNAKSASLAKTGNLAEVANAGSSRANIHVPELTPVLVVATANIASLSGFPTIDGKEIKEGTILLAGQTTQSQNGLWTVPTISGAWSRPSEFAHGVEVKGRKVAVIEGIEGHAHTEWLLSTTATVTVDTTAQTWELLQSSSVVNGSARADYVVARLAGGIVATPSAASGLPMHAGTENEAGTVIQLAITSLKGAGHLHLALGNTPAKLVLVDGSGKPTLTVTYPSTAWGPNEHKVEVLVNEAKTKAKILLLNAKGELLEENPEGTQAEILAWWAEHATNIIVAQATEAEHTSNLPAGHGRTVLANGEVSINDAEIVLNEGLKPIVVYRQSRGLVITGDGATTLNQTAAGKNALKVENASMVDLSGFGLYSGPAALSALCLSDEGVESETSAIGSKFNLVCRSDSTSAPCVLAQNFAECDWPRLKVISTANHGFRIENSSTTTSYGNSTFGLIETSAKEEEPYAALSIVSNNPVKHFSNCFFSYVGAVGLGTGSGSGGHYGLYVYGAQNITFGVTDLETMTCPVFLDGTAETKTLNIKVLDGNLLPVGANPVITCTQYAIGNTFAAKIGAATGCIPIKDEVPAGITPNKYDLTLEEANSGARIAVTNPATQVTLRRIDGGVISPIGTNRKAITYTEAHTFGPGDMGLVATYNAAGPGTFTLPKDTEAKKLPIGTVLRAYQAGAGQLTVSPEAGVTLRNPTGYVFQQYGMVELWCRAENEWVLTQLGLGLSEAAGEWKELESYSTKLESATGQTVRARSESGANVCRLRGQFKVKTGEELKTTEAIGTLPAALRPPANINIARGTISVEVKTNGEVKYGSALKAGETGTLDGLTFNLT